MAQRKSAGSAIRNKAESMVNTPAMNETRKDLKKLSMDAKEAARQAKADLAVEVKKAQERLKAAQKDIERYMADNPKKSAAIAAAAGAAIGAGLTAAVMRRRRRSREH